MGRKFTYDYVYSMQSTQRQVYDEAAFGLVESVLEGYNGKYNKHHSLTYITLYLRKRVRAQALHARAAPKTSYSILWRFAFQNCSSYSLTCSYISFAEEPTSLQELLSGLTFVNH